MKRNTLAQFLSVKFVCHPLRQINRTVLVLSLVSRMAFAQLQPAMPPAPILSDADQIRLTVTSYLRSHLDNSIPSSVMTGEIRIKDNASVARYTFVNLSGEVLKGDSISLDKVGLSWRIRESPGLRHNIQAQTATSKGSSSPPVTANSWKKISTTLSIPTIVTDENMLINI